MSDGHCWSQQLKKGFDSVHVTMQRSIHRVFDFCLRNNKHRIRLIGQESDLV